MSQIGAYDFSTLKENLPVFSNVTSPANLLIAYAVLYILPRPEGKKNCAIFCTKDRKTYQVGEACPLSPGKDKYTPVELPELSGKTVTCLSVGPRHAAAVLQDGTAYTWGANEVGQLGHGDETPNSPMKKISGDIKFSKVFCSSSATVGLSLTGDVYQWGHLNPRSNEKYNAPHKCGVSGQAVFVGEHHAAAKKKIEGGAFDHFYTWGLGADGRLGHGNEDDVSCDSPQKLKINVEDGSLSTRSSAVVDDSFKVRVFGKNYGNLKVKQGPKILSPVVVKKIGEDVETVGASWTDDFFLATNEDDEQFIFGDWISFDDPDAEKEGTPSKGAPPKKLKKRMKFY